MIENDNYEIESRNCENIILMAETENKASCVFESGSHNPDLLSQAQKTNTQAEQITPAVMFSHCPRQFLSPSSSLFPSPRFVSSPSV